MTGNEITLGGFGISIFLTIVLRMIYGTWEVSNRAKPWIAVGLGMGFSIAAMLVSIPACTAATVATFLAQGFMTGATAVGLYEMTQKAK